MGVPEAVLEGGPAEETAEPLTGRVPDMKMSLEVDGDDMEEVAEPLMGRAPDAKTSPGVDGVAITEVVSEEAVSEVSHGSGKAVAEAGEVSGMI